ncbi:hypothetical protein QQS21_007768 [Conoideocrella luteorostrata]|uniref:LYR motif-containing protein Cup1-like N-terminal domain-containing protein n=1 Tax=Conoideocrella luteorostrata TaxID=1105319 RepID=A0AAJ0CMV1_9HYPO|nr:hypothetical protein QQS21_007768 [Conoideocrella luteorostrata]
MPEPSYPLPRYLRPLHLFRHLLREASYLPPAFRSTVDSTIRTRFHKNRKNGQHTKHRLSKAISSLRALRAANSGDKSAMEALIMKGFGRTGSRRRELMTQLVKSQGPDDTHALESMLNQTVRRSEQIKSKAEISSHEQTSQFFTGKKARTPKNSFFERWDQSKLLQIIRSQKQQQKDTKGTTSWPGTAVKSTNPDQFIPATNIWGKPPAESLVRTKRAHWWRRSADKIMPPLGKGEWDLLQRLTVGAQESGEWCVPQRRACPATEPSLQARVSGKWDWETYARIPTSRAEQPRTMSRQRRTGQYDTGPYGGRVRAKEVSDRWFRRAYNRTWQLTPSIAQDPNTLRYVFAWGSATSNLPSATNSQMDVFEGVDKKGNRIHKTSDA